MSQTESFLHKAVTWIILEFALKKNMPQIQSAKRAVRLIKRRTAMNKKTAASYKQALKSARHQESAATLSNAYSQLDRAAKKSVIHKKKASRLKSRLAKKLLVSQPQTPAKKRASQKKHSS